METNVFMKLTEKRIEGEPTFRIGRLRNPPLPSLHRSRPDGSPHNPSLPSPVSSTTASHQHGSKGRRIHGNMVQRSPQPLSMYFFKPSGPLLSAWMRRDSSGPAWDTGRSPQGLFRLRPPLLPNSASLFLLHSDLCLHLVRRPAGRYGGQRHWKRLQGALQHELQNVSGATTAY